MSKSDNSHYLDKNKTILYTANNLYKEALEGLKNTNTLKEQQGLTPLAIAGYTTARSELAKALLFGNIEACAGLAYFNREGIGGTKNPYNEKLFLTIGSKFGHPACIQALAKLQNNNYDVELEARVWKVCIEGNNKDLNAEITTWDLIKATDILQGVLSKNHVSLDAYNSHIFRTEAELENAASYTPPPAPKPTNYYDPHYNKNTTTTTNTYIPPEQPKQSVKPMGQHPQEKEGCEIC